MDLKQSETREYTLTVGNIEKSMATLVDNDYNLLEIPRYLLPNTIVPGSVVRIKIEHDPAEQQRRKNSLEKLQKDIKKKQMGKGTKILDD